jgi:hypothetical protein
VSLIKPATIALVLTIVLAMVGARSAATVLGPLSLLLLIGVVLSTAARGSRPRRAPIGATSGRVLGFVF